MSSALTLIVLGQAYFYGSLPDTTTGRTNGSVAIFPEFPSTPAGIRRPDYTYTPGIGGHKVHTTVTTWHLAQKACKEEGGHLAIINSPAESNLISQLFIQAGPHANSYSPDYAWIGTHDLISNSGDWQTIDGDSLPTAGFNEWQDQKSTQSPHCGGVYRNGKLSWFACGRNLGYICEVQYVEQYPSSIGTPTAKPTLEQALLLVRQALQNNTISSGLLAN